MSLRNNSERLGAHPSSEAPAPAFAENQFSFILPTMFVELPSRGRFYPEGHPLFGQSAVEIRMMTAKDEDLLTNPDLIKKKVVLDRLIQSLLVDRSLRVDELLVQGEIEGAEQYMEERRLFFWENGYRIRRLNQAYFAFHGAYADEPGGAAGDDPVGEAVRVLWDRLASPAMFLRRMARMNSYQDLQAELGLPFSD